MMYVEFTNHLIATYGEDWLLSQFGQNDPSISDIGGKYWMEDELSDLLAATDFNDQEYLMWLDDFYRTVYQED